MSYTSKYTAEQIENKLTEVFDSTLQTKEIELTSNGTTELTADAGFLGLKSVTVNTNVASSGSGTEEGEEAIRYCNVLSPYWTELVDFTAAIVKCNVDGTVKFYPYGTEDMDLSTVVAVGIIISDSYEGLKSEGVRFEEIYADMVNLGALQTITKEEFYNLEGGNN